ncbi:hypothetical protein LSAT2_026574 [Lamellibrachia satsuma]|nr:hypothetical protein LSAT2_026574 [Lamellibrachia satsuma]
MSLEKIEVVWVGQQREELNISMQKKEIKQGVDCILWRNGCRRWAFGGRESECVEGDRDVCRARVQTLTAAVIGTILTVN